MNSDRSSLDKDKTQTVIVAFAAKGEKLHPLIQDEIIQACGAASPRSFQTVKRRGRQTTQYPFKICAATGSISLKEMKGGIARVSNCLFNPSLD